MSASEAFLFAFSLDGGGLTGLMKEPLKGGLCIDLGLMGGGSIGLGLKGGVV